MSIYKIIALMMVLALTGFAQAFPPTGASGGAPTGTAGGDLSGTYPNPVVAKINGIALSGLATGIIKNTTGTGAPSIAVAGDFPTLNQSTTGSAANVPMTGITFVPANTLLGNNTGSTANAIALTALPFTVSVATGGTGLTSGTSGGVLCYTATGTLASSGLLAANAILIGGGAGVCPSSAANLSWNGSSLATSVGGTFSAGAFFGFKDGTNAATFLLNNSANTVNLGWLGPTTGTGSTSAPQFLDIQHKAALAIRVINSTASTGVTRFMVQEGAGQSTAEAFGVYANNGTTKRIDLTNDIFNVTSTLNVVGSSFTFNGHTCTIVSTVVTCP